VVLFYKKARNRYEASLTKSKAVIPVWTMYKSLLRIDLSRFRVNFFNFSSENSAFSTLFLNSLFGVFFSLKFLG